jgi:hypothetical protein
VTTTITDLERLEVLDDAKEGVDYIITAPGYPRGVEGRTAVAELYRP